ncbi:MAG: ABC transporter ATP-binding protein, partial [Thermoleophilia bacterium]|nr:ABC transporter ATP-binding protein [Thermoleophilia bacterium]
MTPAIVVEGLSKRYRIGQLSSAYGTLRDAIGDGVRRLARRELQPHYEEIWALRDVSFEVPEGQVLGIVGRNGAGKSTLLKILTRITTPTAGRATIRGRVGSLLEVGTGFHPELTGRENIFLNGSVLGMKQREIERKFADIVEFAGVEKFIDTPVKRYSSGMSVRLAFAVAAHLEPEILLVDEVLAVGDAEFQRRCLGRMEDLSTTGRTVLFVSHNMQALTQLCDRALWLDRGEVVLDGPSAEVVARYLQSGYGSGSTRAWPDLESAPGDDLVRLRRVRALQDGETVDVADVRRPIGIEIAFA